MIPLEHPKEPTAPDLGPLRGKAVLIVDDEEDISNLVAMMLRGRDVESIITDNADSAIEILDQQAERVAVVLLDLSVPNSSDMPALDRLRLEHPNTPVIIMTGMAQGESATGRSSGDLVGYLRKPFRPDALYNALAQRGKMSDPPRRRRRDSGSRTSDETPFQGT